MLRIKLSTSMSAEEKEVTKQSVLDGLLQKSFMVVSDASFPPVTASFNKLFRVYRTYFLSGPLPENGPCYTSSLFPPRHRQSIHGEK
jgi:hypothetical protein